MNKRKAHKISKESRAKMSAGARNVSRAVKSRAGKKGFAAMLEKKFLELKST